MNDELDLEKELNKGSNSNTSTDELISNFDKKEKRRNGLIVLSVFGVALLGSGIFFFNPFSNNDIKTEDQSTSQPRTKEVYKDELPEGYTVKENWFEKDYFPIKTEEWQEAGISDQDPKTLEEEIENSKNDTKVVTDSGILPSEKSGFTSNIDEYINSDGSINPLFSFWTQERFSIELKSHVERLLNPVFGEWELFQYSGNNPKKHFNPETLRDIFTENYYNANIGEDFSTWIPVYADWNDNDYGMGDELLANGSRWFGKVVSSSSDFSYQDDISQYEVVYEAKVEFVAWTEKQNKVKKQGELRLKLVANEDLEKNSNRVLIDDAELKVE